MSSGVFDNTIGTLSQSMDLRLMKQNVVSSNIANADTPGFKAKEIDFEQELREALGETDELKLAGENPHHIVPREGEPISPEIYDDPNGVESLDGNTVDRAAEMAKLAENQILYSSSVEAMKKKLGMVRYAITEGGGNR